MKRGPNQSKCTHEVDESLEDTDIVFIGTEYREAASHTPCGIVETKAVHFCGLSQETVMLLTILGISFLGAFIKSRKATINPLTPNDPYRGRTAPLTSKRCILYIYSTNIGTEYFKHGIYSPFFFPLQNAVCFIILTYLVPVLFTFYIQVY